jgi:hypothetical protein
MDVVVHNRSGQVDELREPLIGKRHFFIHQVKRTVATLLTTWKNVTNAFCKREKEVFLFAESAKCASGLF